MFFWRRKREILTEEERAAKIKLRQAAVEEICRQINENMDRKKAEIEKAQRDVDDKRNSGWPGSFDDSAGKARIC